jgi:hypothetical protein
MERFYVIASLRENKPGGIMAQWYKGVMAINKIEVQGHKELMAILHCQSTYIYTSLNMVLFASLRFCGEIIQF